MYAPSVGEQFKIKVGVTMKIVRRSFKIITQHGWQTCEGSVGYDYPFFIYRRAENTSLNGWCLSHMASGYSIRGRLSLKHARSAAQALKEFPMFLETI